MKNLRYVIWCCNNLVISWLLLFQTKLNETIENLGTIDISWFADNKDIVDYLVDKYMGIYRMLVQTSASIYLQFFSAAEKQFSVKKLNPLKTAVVKNRRLAELICKVFIPRPKSLPILASWIIRSVTQTLTSSGISGNKNLKCINVSLHELHFQINPKLSVAYWRRFLVPVGRRMSCQKPANKASWNFAKQL